jgi:tetratricopeptide (TPR) repeat protein
MLFFALGLLAKPMLVTLPFLLLLLDFWPLRRMPTTLRVFGREIRMADESGEPAAIRAPLRRLVMEKLPLLILTLLSTVTTLWAQSTAILPLRLAFWPRAGNAILSYFRYIMNMVWPGKLAVLYLFHPVLNPWHLALAAIALALLTLAAIQQRQKRPYLGTGWFWFLGTLLPVIGLIQVGNQSMADRYTYVPSIGLFIIIAWGGYDLGMRCRIRPAFLGSIALLPVLACLPLTRMQLSYWRNSIALFEHAVRVTADNFVMENNLGVSLADSGQLDAAQKYFVEAVRGSPDYAEALNNLGLALGMQGRIDEGIPFYRAAVRARPDKPEFHHNLACALLDKGQLDEAIKEFETGLRLDPDLPKSRACLARALSLQGRLGEARAQWTALLQREPDNADAHMGLGLLQVADKDLPAALRHLNEAVRLRPNDSEMRLRLGDVLDEAGIPDQAQQQLSEAARINPTNAMIPFRLALVLQRLGRVKEAVGQYREALALNPGIPAALNNLAWILASDPDPEVRDGAEAVRLAEQACELTQYREAVMASTLGAAYAEAGRFEQAVEMARKAEMLAVNAGNKELADKNKGMAQLFLARKPFRESIRAAANSAPATP